MRALSSWDHKDAAWGSNPRSRFPIQACKTTNYLDVGACGPGICLALGGSMLRTPSLLLLTLALSTSLACTAEESYQPRGATEKADLAFVSSVKVGDIILTNTDSGRGCWYLSDLENWVTDFRYCHAALVIERHGERGITTVEALGVSSGVQILEERERQLSPYTETKLAVLRVLDDEGKELAPEVMKEVIAKARTYTSAPYVEPPIALDGDPDKTGIYCSMLPYRAYLDAAGIDLDGSFPSIVTPDELYTSAHTGLVYESAPKDMP